MGKPWPRRTAWYPASARCIGGSQREERLEILESRIRELGMNPKDYWWYCDLRRYGSCKHAGFGLGFDADGHVSDGCNATSGMWSCIPATVGNADF